MNLFSNYYFINFFPFFSTFLFFLLMVMPIMPNGMGEITPMFGVIVLSFWLINKNELLPFYSVFILGMFFDVFLGSMLGLGIFSAVIIKFLLNKLLANKSRVNFLQIFIYTIICFIRSC